MRTFNNKARRDTDNEKLHPYGFGHPLCDHSFYKYMSLHQKDAQGNMREADNWWGGWDKKISLDSMARHVEDLKCIHAGYFVFKERTKDGELTHVLTGDFDEVPKGWQAVTEEDCCNAIRFNSMAYLLEDLKGSLLYEPETMNWVLRFISKVK